MTEQLENSASRKPDTLRELYLEAVSEDRGPSESSSAAIRAHAEKRAQEYARAPQQPRQPEAAPSVSLPTKPAANDRFWLRHALGGLAAVGLVGWLMLQHAAWWDGTDKGIGAEPAGQVVAETPEAVPADAPSAASTAVAEAAAADAAPADEPMAAAASAAAPAPAPAANAPRAPARASAAMAEKSMPNRPAVQAEITPDAMKEEATVSPSPSASRPARNAPAASKMQSHSAEVMDQAAEKTQEKTKDLSKDLSPLPLCPEEPAGAEAKAAAKPAQSALKSEEAAAPTCRPRKPHEKRPAPAMPEAGAADAER